MKAAVGWECSLVVTLGFCQCILTKSMCSVEIIMVARLHIHVYISMSEPQPYSC